MPSLKDIIKEIEDRKNEQSNPSASMVKKVLNWLLPKKRNPEIIDLGPQAKTDSARKAEMDKINRKTEENPAVFLVDNGSNIGILIRNSATKPERIIYLDPSENNDNPTQTLISGWAKKQGFTYEKTRVSGDAAILMTIVATKSLTENPHVDMQTIQKRTQDIFQECEGQTPNAVLLSLRKVIAALVYVKEKVMGINDTEVKQALGTANHKALQQLNEYTHEPSHRQQKVSTSEVIHRFNNNHEKDIHYFDDLQKELNDRAKHHRASVELEVTFENKNGKMVAANYDIKIANCPPERLPELQIEIKERLNDRGIPLDKVRFSEPAKKVTPDPNNFKALDRGRFKKLEENLMKEFQAVLSEKKDERTGKVVGYNIKLPAPVFPEQKLFLQGEKVDYSTYFAKAVSTYMRDNYSHLPINLVYPDKANTPSEEPRPPSSTGRHSR